MIERFRLHLDRVRSRPYDELGRGDRALRYTGELARHCARRLVADRATEMAAALTYRTIFGLVPAVVISLLLFKAFVGLEGLEAEVKEQAYQFLNLSQVKVPVEGASAEKRELQTIVNERVADLTERAYQLDFRSIGGVGLALLIWAALALLITVENCFNNVCHAATGRPWRYRVPVYWTVLTLGPLLLTISLYAADRFVDWARELAWVGPVVEQLSRFTALGASWLLLLLLYELVPNARIRARAAMVGALVAALLWEGAKVGFESYLSHAVPYSALYGSLGLIPLFLVWVYATWLIVLFGLELTHGLQTVSPRAVGAAEARAPGADPRLLLPALATVGERFRAGRTASVARIAHAIGASPAEAEAAARRLRDAGWIHPVAGADAGDGRYALAHPPERIPVAEILRLAARPGTVPGAAFLERLEQARLRAAADMTLADVLADGEDEAEPEPA